MSVGSACLHLGRERDSGHGRGHVQRLTNNQQRQSRDVRCYDKYTTLRHLNTNSDKVIVFGMTDFYLCLYGFQSFTIKLKVLLSYGSYLGTIRCLYSIACELEKSVFYALQKKYFIMVL